MMFSANFMSMLKGRGALARPFIARLKALAPYALVELVLPGGSVMALLLWLCRRRKAGADFRPETLQRIFAFEALHIRRYSRKDGAT